MKFLEVVVKLRNAGAAPGSIPQREKAGF